MAKQGKTAVIIGAGPAGLTAAYELLEKTDIHPVVFEASRDIGGISKTVNYKGNRIDIGGHRFFSKSDRVMAWWVNILPLQKMRKGSQVVLNYQGSSRALNNSKSGVDPDKTDEVMLVRSRLSRMYHDKKFFNYPVTLDSTTIKNLGMLRMAKIGLSYTRARLFPLEEKSLGDFYINRFGMELYNTFFRDYTEKVWGVSPKEIDPSWGAQRVKGVSVTKVLAHAVKDRMPKRKSADLSQKGTETSLIGYFLYPKFGPGQMWETVASIVKKKGGEVRMRTPITKLHAKDGKITGVTVVDAKSGKEEHIKADYVISSMPIRNLIASLDGARIPSNVREVADGLMYRDFITVGVLLKKLKIKNETGQKTPNDIIPDNWIYIHDTNVKVGRLQFFNNWSPYMVKNPKTVWVGMEYFCNEGDELSSMSDKALSVFAIDELAQIGIADKKDVLDSTVLRVEKAYPAYFGTYDRFDEVRKFTDRFENLYLVGRNGAHRYNNQDQSMLASMVAVENIIDGRKDKENIWDVNAEKEYHESK